MEKNILKLKTIIDQKLEIGEKMKLSHFGKNQDIMLKIEKETEYIKINVNADNNRKVNIQDITVLNINVLENVLMMLFENA